jgi:UDP-N-acetylglucosamine 2-epimerase (non-hydrolysing)
MKVAPILTAFRERNVSTLEVLLVHTGQHYDADLSSDFFRDLGMPAPDINLEVGSGSHAQQTARVMVAFEAVCRERQPDWVVVVGDVNSTLACALTAKKLGIQAAHVEAGLRSYDRTMPEEINRLCTDAICDLLFTTDEIASANLRREGVAEDKIHFVGNTMIDSLFRHLDRALSLPLPAGVTPGGFALLTLHRPSNVDDEETLRALCGAVTRIADRIPIVFPVHPRTSGRLAAFGLAAALDAHPAIRCIAPLSYLQFIGLVGRARLVLTDSGGIQEETTVLGIPCITMRTTTERPLTCRIGTNVLAGADPERIEQLVVSALERRERNYSVPEKWDGHAAERIVDVLLSSGLSGADTPP